MQGIMRLGSKAFVEGANHLHRPELRRDIRLRRTSTKLRGSELHHT
jgi:hypothetical protein